MMGKFLKDDNGNDSSMRIVWVVALLIIFGTWAYVSITKGQLQNFQLGDTSLIAVLFGAKVCQKKIEIDKEKK